MYACVDAEDVAESHVVLSIKGGFVRIYIRSTHHRVDVSITAKVHFYRLHLGAEHVVGVVAAKTNLMVRQRRIVEIDFSSQVVDARLVNHVELFFDRLVVRLINGFFADFHAEVVAVLGIVDRSVHKELLRHHMVPTQRGHLVAPFPVDTHMAVELGVFVFVVPEFHAEIDGIIACVETKIKPVLVGDFPVEFGVEVIEVVAHVQFAHVGVAGLCNP